jgi:hypothetical protein
MEEKKEIMCGTILLSTEFVRTNSFIHPPMGLGVSVTVHLFLKIRAHHGRWKDSFLSSLFIRISKQNE